MVGGTLIRLTEKDKARFWSKVIVTSSKKCWIWTGVIVRDAGQFALSGKGVRAPRVVWSIFNGDPEQSLVCHRCDQPLCCNPGHLFLGSTKTNQEDCAIKGRRHNTKLTPAIVNRLRVECVPNDKLYGYSALARKYNVNPGAIWQAVNKTRWQHVGE